MATRTIKLHVHSNNASNGILNVKVTPWRVKLKARDIVEWELDTAGADNMIAWFRVEQIDQEHSWPFDGNPPPDPAYTAMSTGTGKVTTQPRNNANATGVVVRYGLTVGFQDEDGRLRILYIDPDMIIDT